LGVIRPSGGANTVAGCWPTPEEHIPSGSDRVRVVLFSTVTPVSRLEEHFPPHNLHSSVESQCPIIGCIVLSRLQGRSILGIYYNFLTAFFVTVSLSIPAASADTATSKNLIGQSWYCTDSHKGIHRFVFSPNGTFTAEFWTPTAKHLRYWAPEVIGVTPYSVVSSSQIRIGSGDPPPFWTISYLSPREFKFRDGMSSYYDCTHAPPSDDRPENAAAATAERAAENKFFYGKWMTKDGLQSVEFFPEGSCVITSNVKSKTVLDISMYRGVVRGESSLYSSGTDISCGEGGGAFSRIGPNSIDFTSPDASINLYRVTTAAATR